MKKLFVLSVCCIFMIVACHRKTAPTTTTPPPPPAVDNATLEAGKTIYTTKCAKCHPAKPVENYDTERWARILKSMIPKAKLDEAESAQVTAYVNANAKK